MASPSKNRQDREKTPYYRKCVFFALLILSTTAIAATDLSVASYDKVSSQRISRVVYKFTYTLSVLNNGGADAFGVTATVTSTSPHTVIVDGDVTIGDITAGSSKLGGDTFSFQHDRRYPFDPNALHFAIQSTEPPATVTVPYVQKMTQQLAEERLQQAGLIAGAITSAKNLTVPVSLVATQSPTAGTEVASGSAVDLGISIPPEQGWPVPENWAGKWRITFTYINPENKAITLEQTVTNAICPGDVVGLSVLNNSDLNMDCSNLSADDTVTIACTGPIAIDQCLINLAGRFSLMRRANSLLGKGDISMTGNSFCPNELLSSGQFLQIDGILLSDDPGECSTPRSSLTQSFLKHPWVELIDEAGELGE